MSDRRKLGLFLAGYVLVGVTLCFVYRDAARPEAGIRFLLARDAWNQPRLVAKQPVFTLLYALPALLGYPAAKIFSLLLAAAAALQTVAAARALRLDRAWLAAPFLLASPLFFQVSIETMPEPLFALLFATALRLRFEGRATAAMVVASFLPATHAAGLVVVLVWALSSFAGWRTLWLGLGGALALTGGFGPARVESVGLFRGLCLFLLAVGPLLVPYVLIGWIRARWPIVRLTAVAACVLMPFLVAGGPRLVAALAPAFALLVLAGWDVISRPATGAGVLVVSFFLALASIDLTPTSRDFRMIEASIDRARDGGFVDRATRIVSSEPYGYIYLDRPLWNHPFVPGERTENVMRLLRLPEGTLVLWDGEAAELDAHDFEAARFFHVENCHYRVRPLYPWPEFVTRVTGRRVKTFDVFFKEPR